MENAQNEHLRLGSSSDPDESGPRQIYEGKIVDVLERISEAFYAVDHAWRFIYVNRHAEELWGRSQKELLGKNIWEEFPHACGSEYQQQLNRAMEQGVTTQIEMVSPISGAWIFGRAYPSPTGGISVYFQNVTEHKQVEKALQESNRRIDNILESITEDFFALDREWRYTYINGRALRRIQRAKGERLTRECLLGRSAWEVFPESVGTIFYQKYHEAMWEQKTVQFEGLLPLTGEWYEAYAHPSEEGLAVYLQDITERKQAEERFRATFEQAAVGYALISVDGSWLRVNHKLCEILGYTREELFALTVQDISYPEDHDADLAQVRRVLASEIEAYTMEKRYLRKDGSLVWATLAVSLVRSPSGEPEYFVGAVEDITKRKRAEEALQRSEERFRAQYKGLPVPTVSWRKVADDFELVDYNEAADQLTQGKLADLVGLRASEWYSDDPQIMEALSRCYDEGITLYQEKPWHMRTTGEHKHLAVTFAYVPPDLVMTHTEDITQRKRAEEALKEGYTLLRSVVEGTTDAVFVKDVEGRLLMVNSSAARYIGKPIQDILGKYESEFHPAEVASEFIEFDREVMTTQEARTHEERVPVNGTTRTFLTTKAPYRDHRGEVVGVIGVSHDITERKRMEEALRRSEERYRTVVEEQTELICRFLPDKTLTFVNEAYCRYFGKEPEELIGHSFMQFLPSKDHTALEEQFSRFSRENPVKTAEHQVLGPNGEMGWHQWTNRAIFDKEGRLIEFQGVGRDITERKQAREALERAKERFHSLVQNSSDSITILAADGTIHYESPAVERVLGYRPEELVGKNAFDYIHPEDLERVSTMFAQVLDNTSIRPSVEYRFLHANGAWRHLESISSNQLRTPGVQGVVINSRDVTDRKKLEENQQRFLTNAAHQLKTPITTIAGAAELLVTKPDLDATKRRQLLDHIFYEGRHMQQLSDTLLRLARVGSDLREPDLKVVDLAAAGRQVAERMVPFAESSGLSLRIEGDGGRVLADPEWLQEVLLVLLSNAVKYSNPGQEITLRFSENVIAVEDEGPGISSDDLTHVFERFYKGRGSVEGFGLGLSICRELVEKMGGRVALSSTLGTGTTAEVELPKAEADA